MFSEIEASLVAGRCTGVQSSTLSKYWNTKFTTSSTRRRNISLHYNKTFVTTRRWARKVDEDKVGRNKGRGEVKKVQSSAREHDPWVSTVKTFLGPRCSTRSTSTTTTWKDEITQPIKKLIELVVLQRLEEANSFETCGMGTWGQNVRFILKVSYYYEDISSHASERASGRAPASGRSGIVLSNSRFPP